MKDITCAAEIYSLLREYIPIEELDRMAEEVVAIMMDEGYSLGQIEQALSEHDEIYDAIEDATLYGEDVDTDDYVQEDDFDYQDEE